MVVEGLPSQGSCLINFCYKTPIFMAHFHKSGPQIILSVDSSIDGLICETFDQSVNKCIPAARVLYRRQLQQNAKHSDLCLV